jgi:hypothetical protein
MARELPPGAIAAFDQLNLPWPGIDEDQLRYWATDVRDFAQDMTVACGRVRAALSDLAAESRSAFIDALSAYWEQQAQLINGITDPLDTFAGALETAASNVETRKQVVINAVNELVNQLIAAAQAPMPTTASAEQAAQTTHAQQVSQARQAVSVALNALETDLRGPLLNAIQQVTDYANGLAASLRAESVPRAGAVEKLSLSYGTLHQAVQAIRRQAAAADKSGETAKTKNANRDLRDADSDIGAPSGDGGTWRFLLQSIEQSLSDLTRVLFTTTSGAISHYQSATANALDKFADEVKKADASERAHAPDHTAARESRLTLKIQESAGAKAAKEWEAALKKDKTAAEVAATNAKFFKELREHAYDPAWQTGAMRVLGTTGLARLESHVPGRGETHAGNMRVLAMAVAAAMAQGVTFPNSPAEDPVSQPYDLSVIAGLLQYGDFSPQILAKLGAEALQPVGQSAQEANEVFAALAANPQAAGLFITQNAPQLVNDIGATDRLGNHIGDLEPLVAVLRSGTLGLKGTDPTRAANAVSALVQAYYNDQNAFAPTQFGALYGDIIKAYWPDVTYAVMNPPNLAGSSPDGLSLTSQKWAPFIDEAMRDPHTAAKVLMYAHGQGYQLFQEQARQPVEPNDPYQYAREAGTIDGYFDYQAHKTYTQLNLENPNAWKATLTNDILLAAIWASPGQGEVAIPASLGADVILPMIDNVLDPRSTVTPPTPSLGTMQEEIAIAYYNQAISSGAAASPSLQSMVKAAKTANPSFLTGDHTIVPLKQMSKAQQAAFSKWLKATVDPVDPVLGAAQTAYLSAASPQAQPGG